MRIKWKTFIRGVVAVFAAVIVMWSTAFPVSADSFQTFKNVETGRYISGDYGILPAYARVIPDYWNVHHWNDGTVELSIGGYALDHSAHGLRTYPRNKSEYQSWWVIRHSDGTISFKNEQTGKCIQDTFYYGLSTHTCNNQPSQRFY
ncbi:RICIN domain-containing protein [Halobacillus ihumii]|uniref:RICIN domain-containing protein n=1 Tax=Halobacillus ihumii TaxID=2686092 RepID=UPI0013D7B423|nr:hypothetical protein [Halobacillus ihumii]